jgi:uncharacterized pyridoxal phosphate-containing UPF0001 family protein
MPHPIGDNRCSMPATLTLAENLARIEDRIAAACRQAGRNRSEVKLMAVSKMHPAGVIAEGAAAGLTLFGENRVQEFQHKPNFLVTVEVHLIGICNRTNPPKQPRFSTPSIRLTR